jgi:hypothetical protein
MRKITILGKGNGWKDAPNEDILWGVNDVWKRRDVDVVFNMHTYQSNKEIFKSSVEYVNKYQKPFVTLKEIKDVPTSIRFPIEEMHTHYFTNSIAYMIAYALYRGVEEINIYGCGLDRASKYAKQKHNIEYWVGYARGCGINVVLHGKTELLAVENGEMYGYNERQTKF